MKEHQYFRKSLISIGGCKLILYIQGSLLSSLSHEIITYIVGVLHQAFSLPIIHELTPPEFSGADSSVSTVHASGSRTNTGMHRYTDSLFRIQELLMMSGLRHTFSAARTVRKIDSYLLGDSFVVSNGRMHATAAIGPNWKALPLSMTMVGPDL